MSDYSFMKTGNSSVKEPDYSFNNNLLNILELFTSNSIKNSARFIQICGRNGITGEDMKYGLIYEVFEFFNRNSNIKDLKEIELLNENDDDEDDNISEYILPDDELQDFNRINIDDIKNESDKEFVTKLYSYYDGWGDWVPKTPIEQTLKNSIDKIYNK